MKFLQISDIHYLEHYPKDACGYKSILPNITSPLIHLEEIGIIAHQENVDAIFITGDLTDDGHQRDYEILHKVFQRIFKDIPLIIGLGNHDNHDIYNQVFNQNTLPNSHLNTVIDFEPLRVIYFDNTNKKSPVGGITKSQQAWLKEILNASEKPVILLTHHHMIASQSQIPSTTSDDGFKSIIENSQILGLFCGHTHHAYVSSFASKLYSTAPSLSFQGVKVNDDVIFEENPGYQLIKYNHGVLSVETKYLYLKPRRLSPSNSSL